MTVKVKNESALKMANLTIDEIKFSRSKILKLENLKVGFSPNFNYEKDLSCTVSILANISSEENAEDLNLSIKISAQFEMSQDDNMDEQTKKFIMERNTLSILFPFLRSTITLVTSQPNMEPIVLPPININAMIKDLNETRY